MLSAEPEFHPSRARNCGTVPHLRKARTIAPGFGQQKFKKPLSRRGFSDLPRHSEARSSLPRFHVILRPQRHLGPSVRTHRAASVALTVIPQARQSPREGRSSADLISAIQAPSTAIDGGKSRSWQKLVARRRMTTAALPGRTERGHFLLPMSRLAAERIVAGRVSQEYRCLSRGFARFRRSAKAFPFGLPGTTFWPTRSTPLVAISPT